MKKQAFFYCLKCKAVVLPHTLCDNCGTYAGREYIDVMAKLTKKEKKKKEKELKAAQHEEKQSQTGLSMEQLSKK